MSDFECGVDVVLFSDVVAILEKLYGERAMGSVEQGNRLIQAIAEVQQVWTSLPPLGREGSGEVTQQMGTPDGVNHR